MRRFHPGHGAHLGFAPVPPWCWWPRRIGWSGQCVCHGRRVRSGRVDHPGAPLVHLVHEVVALVVDEGVDLLLGLGVLHHGVVQASHSEEFSMGCEIAK